MISQTSEYALRAMVYLAKVHLSEDNGPAVAQDVADATKVPVNYLQKILRLLANGGILASQRGTGGGFSLAKAPSAITVLDILRATGTAPARIERCPLGIAGHTQLCPLHHLLDEQVARSEQIYASTSIADLLTPRAGARACDALATTPLRLEATSKVRD